MRIAIRWKLALTYFCLVMLVLAGFNLFLWIQLEKNYLGERKSTYLTHAQIISTTVQESFLRESPSLFHTVRDFGTMIGARVVVLDARGQVLIDSFSEEWLEGLVLEHGEIKAALNGSSATGVHKLASSEQVLYVAVPILEEKVSRGAIMLVAGVDDVYQDLGAISRQMVLISLLCGLLVSLLSLILSGILTRPVNELTTAVQGVAAGNLDQKIPVRGRDELGLLASAFNDMSSRLTASDRTRKQFLADASHELKSPLTSIKALAESLLNGQEEDVSIYREYLQDIDTETDRLARIVDRMLQLSRLEDKDYELHKEMTGIEELVSHVTALMQRRAAENGVDLIQQVTPGIRWQVNADLFTRVLTNLLDNALCYTPQGGRVSVEVHQAENNLVLRVTDSGIGIPAAELPRIFDRFYRVDKARTRAMGGTGLGLPIVRQAVERHGGTIAVASSPGEGTTFEAKFPE
ncbi:MAG: ATP-binding protein [Syntrophomonadales bacterium]|jgi:two-component system OmpR family sensor kinase